jgi:hypothetical protein
MRLHYCTRIALGNCGLVCTIDNRQFKRHSNTGSQECQSMLAYCLCSHGHAGVSPDQQQIRIDEMLSTLFPRSCCSDLHIIRSVGASVSGSVALLVPVLAGHQLCLSTAFQKFRIPESQKMTISSAWLSPRSRAWLLNDRGVSRLYATPWSSNSAVSCAWLYWLAATEEE